MDDGRLYQRIAEKIRQEILTGALKPAERLPAVRAMAASWGCTIGTVQRAYQELAQLGLITVRPGQGTHVVDRPPIRAEAPLRFAALVHRAESFLLETITAGHNLDETERALHLAMDRWRTLQQAPEPGQTLAIRFAGSHDLAIAWLAGLFPEVAPGYSLEISFSGSLSGLIALAEGKADLAGCHLWDQEHQTYNEAFVSRLFPGQRMALLTLAHRRLGLIVAPGNPKNISALPDLARSQVTFINRQTGSGTRVWLDTALQQAGVAVSQVHGYTKEKPTHSAVAQAIAESQADAGLGLEAAARSFGLDFIHLTRERYDLVMTEARFHLEVVQRLAAWLQQPKSRKLLENLSGYETQSTGQIVWIG